MIAGQRLHPDTEIHGTGGAVLRYQGDGNLVLYGPGGPLWATVTSGAPGYVEMQGDGNLVVYDAAHVPIWASGSSASHARLVIERTGLRIEALSTIWKTPAFGDVPPPAVSLGRLAVEPNGRYFRDTETGARHDWREATGFALLALVQAGRHDEARTWMRTMRGYGITQARVLATYTIGGIAGVPDARPDRPGYWEAFDALIHMAGVEGFRLRLCIFGAVEPFGAEWVRGGSLYVGDVFDRAHAFAADVAQRVKDQPHITLELANEPAGTGWKHLDDALVRIGQTVKREAPGVLLTAGDVNDMDFSKAFSSCFDAVSRHQDRNAGLRWLHGCKRAWDDAFRNHQPRSVPALSDEWVNLGAARLDGNKGDPACPYPVTAATFAAVCRSAQMLPTFHWDSGLYCRLPHDEDIPCLEAFRDVLDVFPMLEDSRWHGGRDRASGNYWSRTPYPSDENPFSIVEEHVHGGHGPYRVFGIGRDWSHTVAAGAGWDEQRGLEAPAERVYRIADDRYALSVYRRLA